MMSETGVPLTSPAGSSPPLATAALTASLNGTGNGSTITSAAGAASAAPHLSGGKRPRRDAAGPPGDNNSNGVGEGLEGGDGDDLGPSPAQADPQGAAILQLSTTTHAFVFDLLALRRSRVFREAMVEVFGAPGVLKLGFDMSQDIAK